MVKRINPAFGQKVQSAREARGLTQQALSRESGVPMGTLREIEQGRREPLFGAMQRLATALGVPLTDFPATTEGEETAEANTTDVKAPAKLGRPKNKTPDAPPAAAPAKKPRAKKGPPA